MDLMLKGKVAIVGGASKGLGRACAQSLADEGVRLTICSRSQADLEKAAREMTDKPLVVFPEGTRSKDGKLLPFKLGGARLALLAQAVIVPVLIEGSRDAIENRKAGKGRVAVRLTAFPPFDAKGLDEGKASQARIKEYVERCWHGANAPS